MVSLEAILDHKSYVILMPLQTFVFIKFVTYFSANTVAGYSWPSVRL